MKDITKTQGPADDVANSVKEMNLGGQQQPNIVVSNTAELERVAKTRKNLTVAEEYKKLKTKENANFVVIGICPFGPTPLKVALTSWHRPRGRWQEYPDGKATL